jgi:membrane-bound lytic murein transglycosylase D
MIRQQLREGGLPEDMYYLALIESGFDPNAYSKAAAVGMWQFMTATAKGVGLRVDWWLDERRDPVRSTTAAVSFLKGLNAQFGSMYLAAAAYNGGPGRVSRALSSNANKLKGTTGDDLFFALAGTDALKAETKNYVPQLIASALVGKAPWRFGMNIVEQPVFEYDSVRVGPSVALGAIAIAASCGLDCIRDLNPQILRGMTPPRDSVFIRVPLGAGADFDAALGEVPEDVRLGARPVKTREGESIASIAKRSGITTAQLNQFNPGAKRLKSGNLVVGQTILVPTRETASAGTGAPDPAIERYGSVVVGAASHIVAKGENLGAIAQKYGTTVKGLKEANSLKSDMIRIGQVLTIPRGR